jgi:hypothetical protein
LNSPWLPRSEWNTTPSAKLVLTAAMSIAAEISPVCLWLAIAQPITSFVQQSRTVARNSHPSHV